jgi:hypothetical protein
MALQRALQTYSSNRGILQTIIELCIPLYGLGDSRKQIFGLQIYCSCSNDLTCDRLICLSQLLSIPPADIRLAARVRKCALHRTQDGLSFIQRTEMSDYLVKNYISGAAYADVYDKRAVGLKLGLNEYFGSLSMPFSFCKRLEMGYTLYITLKMLDLLQSSITSQRELIFPYI